MVRGPGLIIVHNYPRLLFRHARPPHSTTCPSCRTPPRAFDLEATSAGPDAPRPLRPVAAATLRRVATSPLCGDERQHGSRSLRQRPQESALAHVSEPTDVTHRNAGAAASSFPLSTRVSSTSRG